MLTELFGRALGWYKDYAFLRGNGAGKPMGILAPVEADARRYMQMGATFVAVGSDLGVLRMATQALCDKYRAADAGPIAAQY